MNQIRDVAYPLVVDLDGTLICTDMLHESAVKMVRDRPFAALQIPYWLLQGKAVLKQQLAHHVDFDASLLPYHEPFLDWLRAQHAAGRRLVLCTASDLRIASAIAAHLGIFEEVMASDGAVNLAGEAKAQALRARLGARGFDYAGNSTADLAVWRGARRAIVVNASPQLSRQAAECCEIEQVFVRKPWQWSVLRRLLRVHQWLKNILLWMPLLAAHRLMEPGAGGPMLLAFLAFSLCASSVYVANDLFDLESDRAHPRKRQRPFASGAAPLWLGVVLLPLLWGASLALASCVGGTFAPWLLFYFALTWAYSLVLKRLLLVDCLTLAILYTLRIVAGAAAAGLALSFWLLAFSVFLFLSLAFVKRYAELELQLTNGKTKAHGRGYHTGDASIIQTFGVVSGYSSAVVLALYLNSEAVLKLYRTPACVWGAVLVVLFWISWMWMQAHHGKMHDDPLVFAVKDKTSLLAGAAVVLFLVLGAVGLDAWLGYLW